MTDDKPLEHVPNPDARPALPAQPAVLRPARHRLPSRVKREPFLPADHVTPRHHLKPGD